MKNILLTIFCLFVTTALMAQHAHFTTSGTIEYTKRINMYTVLKNEMEDDDSFGKIFFEAYQKANPQFKEVKATLTFADNKTLFTPAPNDENRNMGSTFSDQINNVYTDLNTHSNVIHKVIFDDEFLVRDSVRKIKWKITDETRQIAGYTCRRANGLIMDSVYVVAFYTNQIPVPGGPESFTGLPGMILQVAAPHENITWMATKVSDIQVPPQTIIPPKKGKVVNRKQLYDQLKSVMKSWGKEGVAYMKLFML